MLHLLSRNDDFSNNYSDILMPMLVETVIIGVLINILSGFIAEVIPNTPTVVFIVIFLLVSFIFLFILWKRQIRKGDVSFMRPAEYGGFFSISFFIQLVFFDCARLGSLNNWVLVGAGIFPAFLGSAFSSQLEKKWKKYQKIYKNTDGFSSASDNEHQADAPNTSAKNSNRISIREALKGIENIENHPGIIIIIAQTILSLKKSATQSEIFAACSRITRRFYLSRSFLKEIRKVMALYVEENQLREQFTLHTEDPQEWYILDAQDKH